MPVPAVSVFADPSVLLMTTVGSALDAGGYIQAAPYYTTLRVKVTATGLIELQPSYTAELLARSLDYEKEFTFTRAIGSEMTNGGYNTRIALQEDMTRTKGCGITFMGSLASGTIPILVGAGSVQGSGFLVTPSAYIDPTRFIPNFRSEAFPKIFAGEEIGLDTLDGGTEPYVVDVALTAPSFIASEYVVPTEDRGKIYPVDSWLGNFNVVNYYTEDGVPVLFDFTKFPIPANPGSGYASELLSAAPVLDLRGQVFSATKTVTYTGAYDGEFVFTYEWEMG